MSAEDFPFATDLANTMNWNMEVEDFEFNSSLEPQGCLIAFHGSQRIGIATCISFGKVGWFGNLVVKEKYRSQGAGSLLVKHAIEYLQNKGVETIGLYAYQNLVGFYGKFGFKHDEDFYVLSAERVNPLTVESQPKLAKERIGEIERFDTKFFGGNRNELLESIILEKRNLSYYVSKHNQILGYVAATVYEKMAWVGPLVFQKGYSDIADSIVKVVLAELAGLKVYLVPSKNETALLNMLFNVGFKEDFSVSRMFLGRSVAKNCIYMAESLERG
jgi:hypothetical protein